MKSEYQVEYFETNAGLGICYWTVFPWQRVQGKVSFEKRESLIADFLSQ